MSHFHNAMSWSVIAASHFHIHPFSVHATYRYNFTAKGNDSDHIEDRVMLHVHSMTTQAVPSLKFRAQLSSGGIIICLSRHIDCLLMQ